jgi:lipopolysaccharide biosynthesis regulator YciM
MFRLLLTIFVVALALVVHTYLDEFNPHAVTIRIGPSTAFDLSPVSLVWLSMAGGAFVVMLLVGLREAKLFVVNWRTARQKRRSEKLDVLFRAGTHAFLAKRTAEAIGLFHKTLVIDPNHTDSLLWLGNIYQAERNYPEAIRLHRKARGIEDRNVEVLLALAKDLEGSKRFEEALQTLEDVIRLDPGNLAALIRKRDLYVRLEKWTDALAVQQRVRQASLSESDQRTESELLTGLMYEVGRQHLERGHMEKARRSFRGAIKRSKQFLPAYIGLAEVLAREGKTKGAGEILEKVFKKTGNVILLHRLEELYLDMGEPGEIIRVYQEATQRDPQNPILKFYLGKLYYRLEMVDEAFDLLSALEGPQEQMADYHKIMANLYLRKQHMEAAVESLKKALGFKKRVVVPYRCSNCRHESTEWAGRCRGCGLWNTCVALPWIDTAMDSSHAALTSQEPAIPFRKSVSPYETV